MKQTILVLLVALFFLVATARAQTGGDYALIWHSVDGGGAALSGGNYTLTGAAGQPDAAVLIGGNYWLSGGFWPPGPQFVYLPLVIR